MTYCINPFHARGVVKIICEKCPGKDDKKRCKEIREQYHTVKKKE